MKLLLLPIFIASLLACTPATLAQAIHPDSVDSYANPAENMVELYPETHVRKKLKLKTARANYNGVKGMVTNNIYPYGLLSTGKAVLAVGGVNRIPWFVYDENRKAQAMNHEFIISSSKDGNNWAAISSAIPRVNLPEHNTSGIAAVYDSSTKRVVVLYIDWRAIIKGQQKEEENASRESAGEDAFMSDSPPKRKKKRKKNREEDAFESGGEGNAFGDEISWTNKPHKLYVSIGKGGRFTKPRDITKQVQGSRRETAIDLEKFDIGFKGICLTKGEHKGRLLFLAVIADDVLCSLYSDDHGRTWEMGTPVSFGSHIPAGGIGAARLGSRGDGFGLTMYEAEDGSIVSFTGFINKQTTWIYSKDGGTSWQEKSSQPGQQVKEPLHYANNYLVLNAADSDGTSSRLLAFSVYPSFYGGEPLTHVALSYDWGLTWPHEKTIRAVCYCTGRNIAVQQITPGTIGMITQRTPNSPNYRQMQESGFTTFSISWLTDGKDDGIGEVKAAGGKGSAAEKPHE